MVPFGLIRAILVSPLKVFGLKRSTKRAFAVLFKQDIDLRHCFHNHDEWNILMYSKQLSLSCCY